MRGIVIDPGAKPELYRLPDTLQELQRFMGGYAQRCPISNRFAAGRAKPADPALQWPLVLWAALPCGLAQ